MVFLWFSHGFPMDNQTWIPPEDSPLDSQASPSELSPPVSPPAPPEPKRTKRRQGVALDKLWHPGLKKSNGKLVDQLGIRGELVDKTHLPLADNGPKRLRIGLDRIFMVGLFWLLFNDWGSFLWAMITSAWEGDWTSKNSIRKKKKPFKWGTVYQNGAVYKWVYSIHVPSDYWMLFIYPLHSNNIF